jgi:hypothetical protein
LLLLFSQVAAKRIVSRFGGINVSGIYGSIEILETDFISDTK